MSGARSRSAAMPPKHSSSTAGTKRSKPSHKHHAHGDASSPPATQAKPAPSPPSPVFFWKPDDAATGYLSQWHADPFTDSSDSSVVFPTAEHYMMYHKALLFDPPSAPAILDATTPDEVRVLGRQVANYDETVWAENRLRIVTDGNRLKFTRGAEAESMRGRLLATGDRELVEASPEDRIWGIGFSPAKAPGSDRKKWGMNLLGKALMAVREELFAKEAGSEEEWEEEDDDEETAK